jgi:hypothetical protein
MPKNTGSTIPGPKRMPHGYQRSRVVNRKEAPPTGPQLFNADLDKGTPQRSLRPGRSGELVSGERRGVLHLGVLDASEKEPSRNSSCRAMSLSGAPRSLSLKHYVTSPMRIKDINSVIEQFDALPFEEKAYAAEVIRKAYAEASRNALTDRVKAVVRNQKAGKVKRGGMSDLLKDLEG